MIFLLFFVIVVVFILQRKIESRTCETFATIKETAKTGDLVLFTYRVLGLSRIVSDASHVGIVERSSSGQLWIWEAHAAGDADYLGVETGGVHVHPLFPRLHRYDGTLKWVRLRKALTKLEERRLLKTLRHMRGMPFDDLYKTRFMTRCALGLPRTFQPLKQGVFCSEFVARVFGSSVPGYHRRDPQCTTPDQTIDPNLHESPRQIKI